MQNTSHWQRLWQANLYLFKPGILLYWLSLSILATLIALKGLEIPPDEALPFSLRALIFVKGALYVILYYKIIDCVIRIAQGDREHVPLTPLSVVIPSLPLRYLLCTAVLTGIVTRVVPVAPLVMLLSLFIFFCAPAMLLILIQKNRVAAMFKPAELRAIMTGIGKGNYFAILFMPLIIALFAGIAFGLGFLMVMKADTSKEEILTYSISLQAFLEPYFLALQFIYLGYFVRLQDQTATSADTLTNEERFILIDANTRGMPILAQKQLAHRLTVAGDLYYEKRYWDAYQSLQNLCDPSHKHAYRYYPAFHLARNALSHCEGEQKEEKKRLEYAMIHIAARGHEQFYQAIYPELETLAQNDVSELPHNWILPLVKLAIDHQHFELVSVLTGNFDERFQDAPEVVDLGFYAAQALDKQGQRAESVALLRDLIARYPDRHGIDRVKRAFEILTQNDQP